MKGWEAGNAAPMAFALLRTDWKRRVVCLKARQRDCPSLVYATHVATTRQIIHCTACLPQLQALTHPRVQTIVIKPTFVRRQEELEFCRLVTPHPFFHRQPCPRFNMSCSTPQSIAHTLGMGLTPHICWGTQSSAMRSQAQSAQLRLNCSVRRCARNPLSQWSARGSFGSPGVLSWFLDFWNKGHSKSKAVRALPRSQRNSYGLIAVWIAPSTYGLTKRTRGSFCCPKNWHPSTSLRDRFSRAVSISSLLFHEISDLRGPD
mmetsp:Transcript_1597/g.2609  ORF Transcript_1597/g.2609 Transcript_1597/m.2609 type:complete len:261 (+) Transcript_1597:497-1279(+)